MKKKIYYAALLVGVSILLSACGRKNSTGDITGDITAECEQSALFNSNSGLTIAPEGYYILNSLGNMYLTYISRNNAAETYLCGKPECRHMDGFFCIETCNAYVGCVLPYSVVYHDGYVYVLKYDTETFDVTLSRISADGSVHEDIMVVGQAPSQGSFYSYVFLNDNSILMVYNPPDFTGEERMVSLDRIDLEKKEKISVYAYTEAGASISCLKVLQGQVFFLQVKKQDGNYIYELMKYDEANGQTGVVIEDNVSSYTLTETGYLFYHVPMDGVYRCDLQTMKTEMIRKCDEETMYVQLAYDGTYLYLENFENNYYYSEDSQHQIFVCNLEGETVNVIPGGMLFTEISDKDYMMTFSFSSEGPCWEYIRKTDIMNSGVTWSAVKR